MNTNTTDEADRLAESERLLANALARVSGAKLNLREALRLVDLALEVKREAEAA